MTSEAEPLYAFFHIAGLSEDTNVKIIRCPCTVQFQVSEWRNLTLLFIYQSENNSNIIISSNEDRI